MSPAAALRVVRYTARTSAMLFASAQAAPLAGRRGARASETLYQAFMVAHVVHFAAVTRYAVLTGGRDLFPGGRDLHDVGGWPTVAAIYTSFAGVATLGWVGRPTTPRASRWTPFAGRAARTVIGIMFTGTFAGRVGQSAWYAAPTVMSAAATIPWSATSKGERRPSSGAAPAPAARLTYRDHHAQHGCGRKMLPAALV